ncbi:MAG: peptidoglycan DL-endopeptidase CwlO [Actinomycetota bacterium]
MAARSSALGCGLNSTSTPLRLKARPCRADQRCVGARLAVAASLLALVHAGGAAASATPPRSWAAPQIRIVTAARVMTPADVATFRPDDTLTAQALQDLASALKQALPPASATPAPPAPAQVPDPARPITMAQLDTRLVQALGLSRAAQEFAAGARSAGLKVPSRFGTEVVARLLGLRTNHPASQDFLELLPTDKATRAEAAYSAARVLSLSGWEIPNVRALADHFALPVLTDWQRLILNTGVARVGMPYVWGGVSDGPETAFGVTSRGGYDCSGFVWRVFKLATYPGEGSLASTLRGRTTYQMSGEVPLAQRIGFGKLEPADVLFFGARGPASQPAQVGHTGIYLGNGWFIHSSGNGVALTTLTGWYRNEFAWARNPLREAGLAG